MFNSGDNVVVSNDQSSYGGMIGRIVEKRSNTLYLVALNGESRPMLFLGYELNKFVPIGTEKN